jgi:hypothetical protein
VILDKPPSSNNTLSDCTLFIVDLRDKISQWLTIHLLYLSRHIKLDRTESLPEFYMISKVHKSLVIDHSICNTYFLVISLTSLLALRILTLIYRKLKRVLSNTPFKPFYYICLFIDEVFSHTKKVHGCNTSTTSHFYSCNFMIMYLNLNPVWCIDTILKLTIDYSYIDSLVEFTIDFGRQQ